MKRRIRATDAQPDLRKAFNQMSAALKNAKQDMEVSFKPFKRDRSLEQNARYWSILNNAAAQIGVDSNSLHQEAKYTYLGYREIEIAGNPVIILNSTTKLNTKQMTDYTDQVEAWLACEHGVTYEGNWHE